MTRTLELGAWIAEAEQRGLITTIDEIAALPPDEKVGLARLEYTQFLLTEHPELYDPILSSGVAYHPIPFFTSTKVDFIRTGGLSSMQVAMHSEDGNGIEEKHVPCVAGLCYEEGLYPEEGVVRTFLACYGTRHANSGRSGDGYTRFILMDRLHQIGMPYVTFGDPS